MSLLTIIREFVDLVRVRGGDAHDSYGGDYSASSTDSDVDSKDDDYGQWIAFDELAQRAAEMERYALPPDEPEIRGLQSGTAVVEDAIRESDLPDAIGRNGRVVFTDGGIHDWIQVDDTTVIDRRKCR